MPAPTIEQIMNGIEDKLRPLPNLRVEEVGAGDYNVTANASVAIVGIPAIPSYRSTMRRGRYELTVPVTVLVSKTVTRVAIRKLLAFANQTGDASIRAALEDVDKTLGGVVEECVVDTFDSLGDEQVGLIGYYGGLWPVRIVASGKD